jgi:hypothetical protein
MSNVSKLVVNSMINKETGELIEETKCLTYKPESEPPYIKLYFQDIIVLNDLPAKSSTLLYEFARLLDYDGRVCLNSYFKKIISDKLGYKNDKIISNYITLFLKHNILKRIARSVYCLNPYIFGKGSWGHISKLRSENIELQIRYTSDGKRIIKGSNPLTYGDESELNISA